MMRTSGIPDFKSGSINISAPINCGNVVSGSIYPPAMVVQTL